MSANPGWLDTRHTKEWPQEDTGIRQSFHVQERGREQMLCCPWKELTLFMLWSGISKLQKVRDSGSAVWASQCVVVSRGGLYKARRSCEQGLGYLCQELLSSTAASGQDSTSFLPFSFIPVVAGRLALSREKKNESCLLVWFYHILLGKVHSHLGVAQV